MSKTGQKMFARYAFAQLNASTRGLVLFAKKYKSFLTGDLYFFEVARGES